MRSNAVLWLLAFPLAAAAQSEIYKPYKKTDLWSAETLYVGAAFRYPGKEPISVTFKASESYTAGKLYLINPAEGDTLYLFDNRASPGTTVDVDKATKVPKNGQVVFMYVPKNNNVPKFTGPNRSSDKYYSSESSEGNQKPNRRFGHRWSVAGRTPGGGVEFGFEDWAAPESDMDFDDAIFEARGLDLEIFPRSILARDLVR